jgi:hypothetical protein
MHMIRTSSPTSARRGAIAAASAVSLAALSMSALMMTLAGSSSAAATAVDLGTAGSFGVLAGTTVTNTGNSVISGDLGVSPGTAVTGFPPGRVLGANHEADAVAGQAQSDLTTAYNVVARQPPTEQISADLAGRTLTTGVYDAPSSMGLTGELTLDAQGDPSAVFVFQAGSTLTTASGSHVTLTNGAQSCNVFWQVGSSATLGTGSSFQGTILALTSISAGTSATIVGRLLARNGAVTLDDNTITQPNCATPPDTDGPGTDGPGTDGPGTDGPGTDGPGTDGPGADGPGADGPDVDQPGVDQPDVDQPDADQPDVDQPDVDQPGTKQVANPPKDFPNTGDGGLMNDSGRELIGSGTLLLLVAGGLLVWWRRGTSTD